MPQIHLSVSVMEDGVLYNLPNIKRNILNDRIVEQGTLGGHFTHVRRRNEMRRDEVMPDLGDIGKILGLEMDDMALTVEFPLTPSISQDSNDLGVVGALVKPIKWLRGDMIKIIIVIDRLRTEVDQHTPHSNLFDDVGGEIGVEFLHHTHCRWMRWLAKCSPSLGRNIFTEEVGRVMKTLFLNKLSVLADGAEAIDGTLVNEPRDIVIWGWVLIGPTPLGRPLMASNQPKHRKTLKKWE